MIISESMNENTGLAELESLFLALGDQTRLRLLNLLRDDEICVGRLAQVLGESQPKISRHLSYLRNSGLVAVRRQGKQIYYKINFPADTFSSNILKEIINRFNEQENLRCEYKKLMHGGNQAETSLESDYQSHANISANTYMRNNRREELETFLL